jgi:hypothetical protein
MTTIREVIMPDDSTSEYQTRPRPWTEIFGESTDVDPAYAHTAAPASSRSTRKSTADRIGEGVSQRRAEAARARHELSSEIADDIEAERVRAERFRGVPSSEVMARAVLRPGRRVGQIVDEPEFDPVALNRANRKLREAAKRQERGW